MSKTKTPPPAWLFEPATLEQPKTREDMAAAFRFLKDHPGCTGKVGVVGFCYGGGIAHLLATRLPDLAAAVPFYGNNPPPEAAAAVICSSRR